MSSDTTMYEHPANYRLEPFPDAGEPAAADERADEAPPSTRPALSTEDTESDQADAAAMSTYELGYALGRELGDAEGYERGRMDERADVVSSLRASRDEDRKLAKDERRIVCRAALIGAADLCDGLANGFDSGTHVGAAERAKGGTGG